MIHWSELGWTAPEIEMEATHKLTPDYDNENSRCEKDFLTAIQVKFIPRQNTPVACFTGEEIQFARGLPKQRSLCWL